MPANRISGIIAGKRTVTADTALRLARAFRTSPEFWLNLQQAYDLRVAEMAAKKKNVLRAVRPLSRRVA